MKLKKRMMSFALSVTLVMSLATPAMASAVPSTVDFQNLTEENFNPSAAQLTQYRKAIHMMSDEEYYQMIGELVTSTSNYEVLETNLESCGVRIGGIKKISSKEDGIQPLAEGSASNVAKTNADISVIASQRLPNLQWRLCVYATFDKKEEGPDTDDLAIVYFDSNKLEFNSYVLSDRSVVTLNSVAKVNEGTIVFNFDDSMMKPNTVYYGVAVTSAINGEGTRSNFGVDYVHTYSDKVTEITSGSISVGFDDTGKVNGSVGVHFSNNAYKYMWQTADIVSFTI